MHGCRGPIRIILGCLLLLYVCNIPQAVALWPQPVNITTTGRVLGLCPQRLKFSLKSQRGCSLLDKAFDRYKDLLKHAKFPILKEDGSLSSKCERSISNVEVHLWSADQSLGLETHEAYSLTVHAPTVVIQASTVYGALHALESLLQLVWTSPDSSNDPTSLSHHHHKKHQRVLRIHETSIYDAPRFRHRGLLIDTARHFLPLHIIKSQLEAMSIVKINVLHWHIVDDQSFPYASERLPELAEKGAFLPKQVYSRDDIEEVVEYARERGIRVVAEFDSPGHTLSWGKSHPEVLAQCGSSELGPMDPSKDDTYSLLWQLLREASSWFPDAFVHIGGDEVAIDCWKVGL